MIRAANPDAPVLEPQLTAHDRRVLGLLPFVTGYPWIGRSAWDIAEALRDENVADVRRVLEGLVHFRHAIRGMSSSRRIYVYGRRKDQA